MVNPRKHGGILGERLGVMLTDHSRRVAEDGVDPRLVFKVKATTRIGDSTWHPRGLTMLGEAAGWTYVVVSDDPDAATLADEVRRYADGEDRVGGTAHLSSFFNDVLDFEPYGPTDRQGPGTADFEAGLLDVSAWPSPNTEESTRRVNEVLAIVKAAGADVVATDLRPQSSVVRCRADRALLDQLLDCPVVERIRTPPAPLIEPSDWWNIDIDELQVEVTEGEPIGIIDDEIAATHPLLQHVVRDQINVAGSAAHTWANATAHATQVAGIAACSNLEEVLSAGARVPLHAPIYGARILEASPEGTRFPDGSLEHQATETAIRRLHDEHGVRVFNLSVADSDAFSGPGVSIWTETLDRLVRELGVVVVTAGGNRRPVSLNDGEEEHRRYPSHLLEGENRLAEPSLAMNAVCVGSIAHSDGPVSSTGASPPGTRAIAHVGEISPFSRCGPGAGSGATGGIKPDFVDWGGNWAVSDTGLLERNNRGLGVVTTAQPTMRLFNTVFGTSFAAPRVARGAAAVWTTNPNLTANGVRALLGISARRPEPAGRQFTTEKDRSNAYGYGQVNPTRAAECGDNRAVMFDEGEIEVDTTLIYEIPIPTEFATGASLRHIGVSLAFDPPVRRQRADYLAGKMRFWLYRNMTRDELADIHGQQPDEARIEMVTDSRRPLTGGARPATLLVERWTQQRAMSPDDGESYWLVVQHISMPWASALTEPYTRQRYAVVVELEDEGRSQLDVYQLVRARLEQRVHVQI